MILLRETDWDVLIVLDACRADYFREVCSPEAEVVRSPGNCTPAWIAKVAPLLAQRQVLYFSANPVVDREIAKRGPARQGEALDLVPLWERLWSRLTHLSIPSVHPWAAVGAVQGCMEDLPAGRVEGPGPRACRAVVVHLLQPHSPYVGAFPLAVGR